MRTIGLFRQHGTVAYSCVNCSDLSISNRDTEFFERLNSCVTTVIAVLFAVSCHIVAFEGFTSVALHSAGFRHMMHSFVDKYHSFEGSCLSLLP
jgi:hypothetical protein